MNTTQAMKRNPIIHYWRKIGAGSLALSIVIHAGIILVAMIIIKTSMNEPKVDFLPGCKSKGALDAHQAVAQQVNVTRTVQREKADRHRVTTARPDVPIKIYERISDFTPNLDSNDDLLKKALRGNLGGFGTMGTGDGPGPSQGPGTRKEFTTKLPTVFSGRCGGWQDRLKKLKDNGGNEQCERAVSASLEWLRDHQNADGSWGKAHPGAMTGLALLCYLGRCETPDSPFFGDNVMRGILFLAELGHKNPDGILAVNPKEHSAGYEHGIATYALGEMHTIARLGGKTLPGMKEAFEKGVQVIIKHQLPDGGWGYGDGFCYRDTGAGDLSVTGWQFQALKAAKNDGLKVKGLHEAIDHTTKYLASKQTKDGGFGNANREGGYNQWNLTGTGLLGLQTLGTGGHKTEIKRGLTFAQTYFTKEPPSWSRNANLYAWYYYTQCFFQSGGESWKRWNDAVLPEILAHQTKDGSWSNETSDSPTASTAPACADRAIYRTTLCTLMLEVYFRYLRVGDREDGSIFDRKSSGM